MDKEPRGDSRPREPALSAVEGSSPVCHPERSEGTYALRSKEQHRLRGDRRPRELALSEVGVSGPSKARQDRLVRKLSPAERPSQQYPPFVIPNPASAGEESAVLPALEQALPLRSLHNSNDVDKGLRRAILEMTDSVQLRF